MIDQPGDETDQRRSGLVLEIQFAQQRPLGKSLARQMPLVKGRTDVEIGGGIPLLDVDAVENPLQFERKAAQDSVESRAVLV